MKTLLFQNATIYPNPFSRPISNLIVKNNTIFAHTEEHPIFSKKVPFKKIDLHGKVVIPAFGDAHVHSIWAAKLFFEIDLSSAKTLQEALLILEHQRKNFNEGQWVIGRGFNKNDWPDGQPHKKQLDALFPLNPVYLESQDCHSAWVNTLTLQMSGINEATPDPIGGKIGKDQSGHLTGLLYDKAMEFVKNHLPALKQQQILAGLHLFVQKLLRNGITSIHTMEGLEAFSLWQKYVKRYGKNMRVSFYIPQEELEELIKSKIKSNYGDDWLSIAGVKFFTDGSLGSQTAALKEPYESQLDNTGLLLFSEKELLMRVKLAESNQLATAIHAIGDRAVEMSLRVLRQTEIYRRKFNLLSRLEHAQLIPPDLLPQFAQAGLMASMQPIHIADDVKTAQKYWGKRSRFAYPLRSLSKAGVRLAFGSDAPVAEPDPLKGIFSAVLRKFKFNLNEPTWIPEEVITVPEAVAGFTTGVAKAVQRENRIGTLEKGKCADFIVLNKDIFKIKPAELLSVEIEKTYLAGREVYSQPQV